MRDHSNRRLARFYLWAVPTVGGTALAYSATDLALHQPPAAWLALTAVATLISSYTIRIPGSVVKLSVSEPLVFLSTLLYGPSAGTVTASIDAVVLSLRLSPKLRTFHRIAFNVGALAISVWPSSHLYYWLTGLNRRAPEYGQLDAFVVPLYVFAAAVFTLNTALVALAVASEKRVSPLKVWRGQFSSFSASYLASAAIAAIIVVLLNAGDFALIALLLPLVVVSVLAVRTTLGRLNDEHQHLLELNRLHISTIETLAMAIDAKDQVTHGHIRRVQRYAVALARALGVTDDKQLRAIEAAALLHDMGKLAIPEFILNKPGRLTPREFAIMKTHAAVGADLLSSIHFPYPVVPIVRHHHENWDGSGYPDGLRGADIPVGARILSVVDCYDALTSHRPYRPALSPDDALEILTQRRGRMYDPLVVDAFVREHAALRAEGDIRDLPEEILAAPQGDTAPASDTPAEPQTAPIQSLRLLAELSPMATGPSTAEVCRQLLHRLRVIAPLEALVLFVPEEDSSNIKAICAEGPAATGLHDLSIPIAERLSGWVAAHRTSVWNSDATLDIGSHAGNHLLSLASGIPLMAADSLLGVLTLYGVEEQSISASQRHAIEALIPSITSSLARAMCRPTDSIDCRSPEVRTAALAALDAILSHDRQQAERVDNAVFAFTLRPIAHSSPEAVEDAAVAFARAFAASGRGVRLVMRMTESHFFCCVPGDCDSSELLRTASSSVNRDKLGGFALECSRISSPLELQDAQRLMIELSSNVPPTGRGTLRVH